MSVYNEEKYIKDTIDSILNQTYQDFEFIIIDDGSTDSTTDIINTYEDDRIKLYKMPFNMGVGAALNFGLSKCSGKYIAKADGDDIYDVYRLQKQKDFLDNNPGIAVVGSLVEYFPADETIEQSERYKNFKRAEKQVNSIITNEEIREKLYWSCCLIHSTVMMRSDILKKVGYDATLRIGEDYKLFYQLNKMGVGMSKIPEVFVKCRVSFSSITALHMNDMFYNIFRLKRDLINNIFRKKKVFIWGAGGYGRAILKIFRSEHLWPSGFVDSNENLWGKEIEGIEIYSPSCLEENSDDKGVIVASDPGRFAIANALDKMGYKHLDNYIIF